MVASTENTLSRYGHGTILTGILYFHRITDQRMSETPLRNFRMFEALCGEKAASNVILVTTMWDKMSGELASKAKGHEEELKNRYWVNMIRYGAMTRRFTNTKKSALDIVSGLITVGAHGQVVLLQEELVNMGRNLNETRAGKELYSQLQLVLAQQKKTIQEHRTQLRQRNDLRLGVELHAELKRIQADFDNTSEQISELKTGFWWKITFAQIRLQDLEWSTLIIRPQTLLSLFSRKVRFRL